MKLIELYNFVIEKGIETDPRGKESVANELKYIKSKYDNLSEKEKKTFDTETLVNPYCDSRILAGTGDEEIKSVLVGIDLESSEVLLANVLRGKGKNIDLLMAHHPEGKAYANFYEVMGMQSDLFNKSGVPINVAEALTEKRMGEVKRRVLPLNHTRAVDAAKLLNLNFMCVHTPADNHVNNYLQNLFDDKKPQRLNEVMDILKDIPEYVSAGKTNRGPVMLVGNKDRHAGKIMVDMTGGTESSIEILENLVNSGIGTMITMHVSEDYYKKAEKVHLNIIIAGHISSDTLGLNLILDKVEKRFGQLDIIPCSGFERIRR